MNIQNKKPIAHYDYRLCIIRHLVKPFYLTKKKCDRLFDFDEEKEEFILPPRKPQFDNCKFQAMDQKRLCMNCYIQKSKKQFTKYWCSTCLMPLCPADCYDEHRRSRVIEDWEYG